MNTSSKCHVSQSSCGRIEGNPVCPKCGIDDRTLFPSEVDRDRAMTAAKARYWETQARSIEAEQAQSPPARRFQTSGAPADAATIPENKSAPASTGSELPKILTAGAMSVAANAMLGVEGWPRYVVTIVCFAVVYGLWSLLKDNGQQDR